MTPYLHGVWTVTVRSSASGEDLASGTVAFGGSGPVATAASRWVTAGQGRGHEYCYGVTFPQATQGPVHNISVVIPVYQGEHHLAGVVDQLGSYAVEFITPNGHRCRVGEVVLVWDNGRDDSPMVMRKLAHQYDFVRTVWLSRNFGQHSATLAGISSSGGDWIITVDEDGQQDPADMALMLDTAMRESAPVVYGQPRNPPPHGWLRNSASRSAKWVAGHLGGASEVTKYNSYRLILGEVGRSVAAYAGAGVYLDVALGWVAAPVATCPVTLRDEGDRQSGYRIRSLLSHFWRLVLTSGTRGLRVVSILGVLFAVFGIGVAAVLVIGRLLGNDIEQGWTSIFTLILISTGAILFALGTLAEYLGVAVNMAMGRPAYLIVSDPADGPLGWPPSEPPREGDR
jgi:glycosyltransferase involved in cell wall biosynthesis